MPKRSDGTVPVMCRHKAKNMAIVRVNGKQLYLGKWGSREAAEAYQRFLAKYLSGKLEFSGNDPQTISVIDLCAEYIQWAERYYLRDEKPTAELFVVKGIVEILISNYGSMAAKDIDSTHMEEIIEIFIKKKYAARTISKYTGFTKRIFKWGAQKRLVPSSVYADLSIITPPAAGKLGVPKRTKVLPVSYKDIEAVKPLVSPQVRALIELQILSAARPGELVVLRKCDIDTSGDVWFADISERHKTAWRGQSRVIYFGPKSQEVLRPFMDRQPEAYLFSALEGAAAMKASGAKARRRSDQKPSAKQTDRKVGDHYSVYSYRRAITRACEAAKITEWHPHQLRHTSATALRFEHDLEAAQAMLGQSDISATQIYAEKNRRLAMEIAKQYG